MKRELVKKVSVTESLRQLSAGDSVEFALTDYSEASIRSRCTSLAKVFECRYKIERKFPNLIVERVR